MPDYFKNILHTQIFSLVNIIIGFFSLFLLIKHLKVEEYGEYVLVQGFLAFLGIIISQNIYSYARLKIPGAKQNIQYGYLKTIIILVSGFYFLIFSIIWLFGASNSFWSFFEIKINLSLIVLIILALDLINAEITRFLIAVKNINTKNYGQFYQKVFALTAIILLLFLGKLTLENFLYLFIVGQLVVLLYFIKKIQFKILLQSPIMEDVFKQGYQIALPLIPIGLMSLALNYTDTLMISKLINKESVAQYGFASQIISIVMMLIGTSIVLTLFPYATEAYNENNSKVKNAYFIKMYKYSIGLSIIFYILIALNATWFFTFLNLEKYKDVPEYLMLMGFFPIFQSIYNVSSHNMQLLKIIKAQLVISIIIIFFNIVLNFFFIKQMGAIGAAYASLLSFALLAITYFFISLKNDVYLKNAFTSYLTSKNGRIGVAIGVLIFMLTLNKNNLYLIFLGNAFVFFALLLTLNNLIKGFSKK